MERHRFRGWQWLVLVTFLAALDLNCLFFTINPSYQTIDVRDFQRKFVFRISGGVGTLSAKDNCELLDVQLVGTKITATLLRAVAEPLILPKSCVITVTATPPPGSKFFAEKVRAHVRLVKIPMKVEAKSSSGSFTEQPPLAFLSAGGQVNLVVSGGVPPYTVGTAGSGFFNTTEITTTPVDDKDPSKGIQLLVDAVTAGLTTVVVKDSGTPLELVTVTFIIS